MTQVHTTPPGNCVHLLFSHVSDTVRACLQHTHAGDSMVLMNTAVLLLLDPSFKHDLPENIQVFAVDADLQAHGLAGLQASSGTMLIDDESWVGLVMSHTHCLSWK